MAEQWLMRPDADNSGRWWIDKAPDPQIPGQTIGPPVANVYSEDHVRLIVTAPDLLAALEAVHEWCDLIEQNYPEMLFTKKVRAAIAKARNQ